MIIRKAKKEDLKELLDIYNYEVEHGVATFDLETKTLEEREEWFYSHNVDNHPLIVAEIDGNIAGYASLSSYREKEAYKSTVELSIYIGVSYRKKGVATALMDSILDEAKRDERTHTVISVITSGNEGSKKLHEKFGFEFCGTLNEVVIKFGEYRDTDSYRLGV